MKKKGALEGVGKETIVKKEITCLVFLILIAHIVIHLNFSFFAYSHSKVFQQFVLPDFVLLSLENCSIPAS